MLITQQQIMEIHKQWEEFLTACDAQEHIEWDADENGEMEAYYSNEALAIAIQLVAADGEFTSREVNCINSIFEYDYSVDTLREVYDNAGDAITNMVDEEIDDGITLMRSLNSGLADMYKAVLISICNAVIDSDGIQSYNEKKTAETLLAAIEAE